MNKKRMRFIQAVPYWIISFMLIVGCSGVRESNDETLESRPAEEQQGDVSGEVIAETDGLTNNNGDFNGDHSSDEMAAEGADMVSRDLICKEPRTKLVRPMWSPDGRFLAYASGKVSGEIYVVDTIDAPEDPTLWSVHPITGGLNGFDIAWSPDSEYVAFSSVNSRGSDIFVSKWDGSELRNITNRPGHEFAPYWSPDGQFISYSWVANTTPAPANAIYSIAGNIEISVFDLVNDVDQILINTPGADLGFGWSPDGTNLLFASMMAAGGRMNGYRLEMASGAIRQLTDLDEWAEWPEECVIEMEMSPSGDFILVKYDVGGVFYDIIDPNGAVITLVAFDGPNDVHCCPDWPGWQPSGDAIVFTGLVKVVKGDATTVTTSLFTFGLDTGAPDQLTATDTGFYVAPAWAPDRNWIAFVNTAMLGEGGLAAIDLESGAVYQIISGS